MKDIVKTIGLITLICFSFFYTEQVITVVNEQDPIMMLAQMSAQALQNQDCQMAMQVCQAFLEIVQQMQGSAPEEPQGEPVFRKGGVLVRRIKK